MRRSGSAEDDCSISPGKLGAEMFRANSLSPQPSDASVDQTNGTSFRGKQGLAHRVRLRRMRWLDCTTYN